MSKMVCCKCGERCDRASAAQKYCRSCSPYIRQLKEVSLRRLCVKCGVVFEAQSNRQKYCHDCSPHFPKLKDVRFIDGTMRRAREVRNLICCRCRVVIGVAKRGQIYLDRNPCDKCKLIAEKEERKVKRKIQKNKRRYFKKYSKWLLENEKNKKTFTRMRYVSEEEIKSMNGGSSKYVCIPIYGVSDVWSYVSEPGYYRVEKQHSPFSFRQVCASGIPVHHRCWQVQEFERYINKKKNDGIREYETNKWEQALKDRENKLKRQEEEYRKFIWNRTAIDKKTKMFFTAITMASAIK